MMKRSSPTLLSLSLLLCLSWLGCVSSVCTPSVCHHGSCIEGECQCDPLFTGPDCSVPFEVCPDGDRQCFNGSECVRNNEKNAVTKKYGYHCDCSKAFGVSSYAGLQCEYSATQVCEFGQSKSTYAFCTNGGTCKDTVVRGQAHPGCDCGNDFEGQHCQYLRGTAPPQDLLVNDDEPQGGNALSGVATFFIVVSSVTVVGLFGYNVWRLRRNRKEQDDTTTEDANDLEFKQATTDKSSEII